MALPSTLHKFSIALSDVDRGVYETLDFRLVRHPSETVDFALVRVLAYALEYAPELTFGPGLCVADEPALSSLGEHGQMAQWIDIGAPSADRLHKANKHADQVIIYTHRELEHLHREWSSRAIHQAETIRVVCVDTDLLAALGETFDRTNTWELLRTEGVLYVTVNGTTHSGAVQDASVLPPT